MLFNIFTNTVPTLPRKAIVARGLVGGGGGWRDEGGGELEPPGVVIGLCGRAGGK